MDSQDSSAPPHHHHHHHHHQSPFPSHHAVLMGQHNPIQQYPQLIPNNNNNTNNSNSVAPTTSAMMHQQNPGFPFNSVAAHKPLDHQYSDGSPSGSGGGGGVWYNVEPVRKKRGRPRKYSPDNSIGLGLSPAPVTQISSAGGHVDSGGGGGNPTSENSTKRPRGRPPGSVKRQLDALGVPGVGFTPHVITVNSGEIEYGGYVAVVHSCIEYCKQCVTVHGSGESAMDVLADTNEICNTPTDPKDIASKIMAFSQQGPRMVCVLSANGAICNVTLRQPAMSGGTVTYEGRFEIISLSGSFLPSENNGSRTAALSVSLAGSDGRVLGGGVAGILKAASPVQVVVGSFLAEAKKSKGGSSSTPPSNMLNFGTPVNRTNHPSSGGSSDSGEENDDGSPPLDHPGSGPYTNAGQPVQNVPIYSNIAWPNSMKMLPN